MPRSLESDAPNCQLKEEMEKTGEPVIYVDLWSTTTVEDMTTRLATAAVAALGQCWQDMVTQLGQRLKFGFEISQTLTGLLVPVPKVELCDAPVAEQRKRLVDALDLLEELAAKHKAHLSVIIDEFQEIECLGSEEDRPKARGQGKRGSNRGVRHVSAMRQVRAAIQLHRHVTYLFAGSDRRLIEQLHDEDGGALHNLGRKYEIGPIEPTHFAHWIERQFHLMGMNARGTGQRFIDVAGPRTRDIRTLAETVAELARKITVVSEDLIAEGMEAVVRQRRPAYEANWKQLTKVQQNILRAVPAEGGGLSRQEVRRTYGIGEASTATKTINALAERAVVLRDGTAVLFDDPFYRAWVIISALPDVGIHRPVTYVPQR